MNPNNILNAKYVGEIVRGEAQEEANKNWGAEAKMMEAEGDLGRNGQMLNL